MMLIGLFTALLSVLPWKWSGPLLRACRQGALVIVVLGAVVLAPWQVAVRAAEGAVTADQEAEALYNRALGMSLKQSEEREKALAAAIERSPGEVRYRIALGDACVMAPAWAQADKVAQGEAIDHVHIAAGRERARELYQEAARAAPQSPIPHSRLAHLAWAADKNAAAEQLDWAIALDPENAIPVYERAVLHFLAGEDEEGRRRLLDARGRKELHFHCMLPTQPLEPMGAQACVSLYGAQAMPHFARLRDLARQCVRVASDLEKAGDLPGARAVLIEAQRAASRVARSEPLPLISMLVGVAIDHIVCRDLEPLAAKMGDARTAERLVARRKAREAMQKGAQGYAAGLSEDPGHDTFQALRDEGELVRKLIAENGWTETVDD